VVQKPITTLRQWRGVVINGKEPEKKKEKVINQFYY
jgi:hypothetical protein